MNELAKNRQELITFIVYRMRDDMAASKEDKVKLTLAVEAKPDLTYNIDSNKQKQSGGRP